ncbi:MAG: hypothetical protein ACI9S8_001529 [Chlamydiales bacterium]|jgi:hypothetical protein
MPTRKMILPWDCKREGLRPKPQKRASPLHSPLVSENLRRPCFKHIFSSALDELRSSRQAVSAIVPIALNSSTSGGVTIPVRIRIQEKVGTLLLSSNDYFLDHYCDRYRHTTGGGSDSVSLVQWC